MEIVGAVAGKLVEYTIEPIVKQYKYLFCYTCNIQNLRDELANLENKRTGVQLLVDAAKRNAEVILPDVSQWLQNVDELKNEAYEVLKGSTNSEIQCTYLRCLNLRSRYTQSRKGTKITAAIAVLFQKQSEFRMVGYPKPPVQTPYPTPPDVVGFETRVSVREEILEALRDEDISIIGICGMAGVGKTTMVNEIVTQVKADKLFDDVAMAVVSKDHDLMNIQNQLAEMLGLKIGEKTNVIVRAGRLHERLGSDDKSVLVVLDDIWEEIGLETIGIPLPGSHKGLKFLYTSRFEHVYSDQKLKKFTKKFEVKNLSKEEAWQLFKDAAGISDDATNIKSIAEQVAEECAGLPLALVTVGKALRNRKEHSWRNALQQLRDSRVTNIRDMHNLVYSRIEFSYNNLQSEEAKSLLLLCSFFPEDEIISIELLVRYARGLELFPNADALTETRDMTYSIADDLKSCYLLQSKDEERVKLHDVVRDVCLSIASKEKQAHTVTRAGLEEWPEDRTNESCTAISLTFNVIERLPDRLKCPHLKILRVDCDKNLANIPEDFFENMQDLRVLHFNDMSIKVTSFKSLLNLKTLCLADCQLEGDLSIIGRIKKLEVLSFYNSFVRQFPSEISELGNLKMLDLRFGEGPGPLRLGFLLGLKKLEELYLGKLERQEDEPESEYIRAIISLGGLRTFQVYTKDPKFLLQILQTLHFVKLQRFQLINDEDEDIIESYHFKRSLHLSGIDEGMHSEPIIKSLMRITDDLHLEVKTWKNPINDLENGFINLEKLKLKSCDFEYLIDATDFTSDGNFTRLQELHLISLSRMKSLWRGLIKPPSLCNLQVLKMHYCTTIRNLFPESVVKCLKNLKTLDVSDCGELEEIVSTETSENEITKMFELPALNYLCLSSLRSFKRFRSESMAVNSMNNLSVPKTLFNQVLLPNIEVLEVSHLELVKLLGQNMQIRSLHKLRVMTLWGCKNVLAIAQSNSIKLLQKLRSLDIVDCESLKALFDFEGLTVDDNAEVILGKLNSLSLDSLPELKYVLWKAPKGIHIFGDLRSLNVSICHNLRYLFSPSIASLLVNLEILRAGYCSSVEEIIGREEESTAAEMVEGRTCKIVFLKLNQIYLRRLDSFRMFCSQECDLVFPSLNKLLIDSCPAMTKFCSGQLSARKLKKVELGDNKFIEISDLQVSGLQSIKEQETSLELALE